MLPHQPQVEAAEQIIATVTSTATKYRCGGRIEEGGMQIFEPGLCRAGKVMMRLAKRVPSYPGQKAETAQRFDSLRQPLRLGVACRGKHGHFRTAAHRGNAVRLHHVSPKQISSAGPVSRISEPGPCHSTVCAPPGAITRSTRCGAAQGNGRASRGAGAGTGRGGGANAALINAYLDFITADHAHEFHICLLGKKRDVGADLFSNRLPGVIVEVRPVDKNDEVGVAG